MYKAFGNIVCDCCGAEVSNKDFIVVKSKGGIQHFCDEKCHKSPKKMNMEKVIQILKDELNRTIVKMEQRENLLKVGITKHGEEHLRLLSEEKQLCSDLEQAIAILNN